MFILQRPEVARGRVILITTKPVSPWPKNADIPLRVQVETAPKATTPVRAGAKVQTVPETGVATAPPVVDLYNCAVAVMESA